MGFRSAFARMALCALLPAVFAAGLPAAQASDAAPGAPVSGTVWGIAGTPAGDAAGDPWIAIAPDGSVTGNSGCNNFFASGSFSSTMFKLTSEIGATRMMCPEPGLMEQESALFSALKRAARFAFNPASGEFWVVDETDETLLLLAIKY